MKGDYANGRIYKIEPICDHEEHEVYYGSTTQLLCKRMGSHRSKYIAWNDGLFNKLTVFDLFKKYGVENCTIYLVKKYPCESREELETEEGNIIKMNPCVNKHVAGRNHKQYCIDNYEQIKKYKNQYYENNKEHITEKNKTYYQNNTEKIAIHNKQYQLNNVELIRAHQNTKCKCILCGIYFTNANKARHEKSQKHLSYINQQTINNTLILRIEATNKAYDEVIRVFNLNKMK
jgi:hypothetical protein